MRHERELIGELERQRMARPQTRLQPRRQFNIGTALCLGAAAFAFLAIPGRALLFWWITS